MEKTVFFVRHGESLANTGVATPDPSSIPLTEKGKLQAKAVSEYFSKQPELIVHSPYIRTLETATPLIERFPVAKVEEWPIHEFTYLDIQVNSGTVPAERKESATSYWNRLDPDYIDGYGAESFSQMLSRLRTCVADIETLHSSEIVVFCHGQIMHALSLLSRFPESRDKFLMEKFLTERANGFAPKNTEVWETRFTDEGKWLPFRTRFLPEE